MRRVSSRSSDWGVVSLVTCRGRGRCWDGSSIIGPVRKKAEGSVPVINCLYLVVISRLGLKQTWSLREYVQDTSSILANNYPEVIDKVFVSILAHCFSQASTLLTSKSR